MLSDITLEKITLFYYFVFLDETKVMNATTKTLKAIEGETIANLETPESQATLIKLMERFVARNRGDIKPSSLSFSAGPIVLPENSNWGPWFEFRKVADDREFRAVVYAKILKFSLEAIAEGMSLPKGTIRYRLGHGLKILGRILQLGEAHA